VGGESRRSRDASQCAAGLAVVSWALGFDEAQRIYARPRLSQYTLAGVLRIARAKPPADMVRTALVLLGLAHAPLRAGAACSMNGGRCECVDGDGDVWDLSSLSGDQQVSGPGSSIWTFECEPSRQAAKPALLCASAATVAATPLSLGSLSVVFGRPLTTVCHAFDRPLQFLREHGAPAIHVQLQLHRRLPLRGLHRSVPPHPVSQS
jgi:hypothetical protein